MNHLPTKREQRAYSILEVLVVVAVIGGLTGIAMLSLRALPGESAGRAKMESDVATINRAIAHYLAFGGDLKDVGDAEEVIWKLKSEATEESAKVLPGLSGSFLDPRVEVVMQSKMEAKSESVRAVWDQKKQKFEVAEGGQLGIKEFRLGEEPDLVALEDRKGTMDYARKAGWIWDYEDRERADPLDPFIASTVDSSSFPGGSDPSGSGFSPAVAPHMGSLAPPLISLPGGNYPIADYALSVTLMDPNPGGAGRIIYEMNGAGWEDYIGGTISVSPETELRARVVPVDPATWNPSAASSATYAALPATLIPPQILSDTGGYAAGSPLAKITLVNPNDPAHSQIEYRLDGGAWVTYGGPFDFDLGAKAEGVIVEAYAKSTRPYHLDSVTVSRAVVAAQADLEPPMIAFDSPSFSKKTRTINVTLSNPNPSGSSRISYQIVPVPAVGGGIGPTTAFMTYAGPFSVNAALYPDGFGIRAFSEGIVAGYLDSRVVSEYASAEAGVFGGHLDLDTSTFIAKIDSGNTAAHTHDITGKYNLTTIDLFSIPEGKQIEIDEAIVDPSARFKLTVVNGDLSPGLTISITYRSGGVLRKLEKPVDSYGGIDLGDLSAFSMGGVPGTAKLESLQLKMEKDLIYDAGIIPTVTGEVVGNVLGKGGEWRNGALTVQAVQVNADGSDGFTTDLALGGGGVHGAATSGLLWEAAVFWHWSGDSYDEDDNKYVPGNFNSIKNRID